MRFQIKDFQYNVVLLGSKCYFSFFYLPIEVILLTNCFDGRYWYEWTKILEILIIFNNFIDMILIMAWQQSVHEQEIISKPASTIKANLNMNEYIHH